MRDALLYSDVGQSAINRFDDCGAIAFVMRDLEDPARLRLATNACRSRWCEPCARDRAQVISANLLKVIEGHTLRLMTLTLKHRDEPLSDQLDRLYHSFTMLRRTKIWRERVQAACAVTEVKRSRNGAHWHPHVHVIWKGRYLPHKLLSEHWFRITGDSYVVDVRPLNDDRAAARYVTKYVTKPWDASIARTHDWLVESINALKGKHLVQAYGEWRKESLTEQPEKGDWECLGTLEHWLRRLRAGDQVAIDLLSALDTERVAAALACLPPEPEPTERAPPRQLNLPLTGVSLFLDPQDW